MARYLIKTTEVYRIDHENDVKNFLEEAKQDPKYELIKYSSQHKELKKQGEILDDWFQVQLVKGFNNEKEPEKEIAISYRQGKGEDEIGTF